MIKWTHRDTFIHILLTSHCYCNYMLSKHAKESWYSILKYKA